MPRGCLPLDRRGLVSTSVGGQSRPSGSKHSAASASAPPEPELDPSLNLIVRESYINSHCIVDGLPLNEIRLITEKSSSNTDLKDERNRRVEFATPAFNLLNALEQIGYKVITSSSFVTGPKKFDTKDYIWTLYRPSCEMEM